MKCGPRTAHLILVPTLVLASSCAPARDDRGVPRPPRDEVVTVKASLTDGAVTIDQTFHDTVLLRPQDRISFRCDCAEGLEFKVTEPEPALDDRGLEKMIDLVREHGSRKGKGEGYEPSAISPDHALAHVRGLNPHNPRARLLPGWDEPDFHSGDQEIGPYRVARLGAPWASHWKFAWIVQVAEHPETAQDWDPHLMYDAN